MNIKTHLSNNLNSYFNKQNIESRVKSKRKT